MSELTNRLHPQPDGARGPTAPPSPEPTHGFWWKTWLVIKVIQARLRFIAILAVIGTVIAYWNTINSYYEKWTRPLYGPQTEANSDTKYYCPMHPFIVRDNPTEKCPICHMDLARLKKGATDQEPLPPGTVSRVQLTPYRMVLAGVQTTPIQYRPLSREIVTFGSVEFNETKEAHIAARQKARLVKLFVNYTGQMVNEGDKLAVLDIRYSPELSVTLEDLRRARQSANAEAEQMARQRLRIWDVNDEQIAQFLRTGKLNSEMVITSPIKGHVIKKYQREGSFIDEGSALYDVVDLDSVWIMAQVYEADQTLLKEGIDIRATTLSLPNEVFRGTLDFVFPHLDETTRTLAVRFHVPNAGHRLRPGMYATVRVDVAPSRVGSIARTLAEDWAVLNTADNLAHALAAPAFSGTGVALLPLLYAAGQQALLQQDMVLAVPDSVPLSTRATSKSSTARRLLAFLMALPSNWGRA